MYEMQPIREIESYANVPRQPVETAKKARIFIKDNQQNMLDDSIWTLNNGINSNTYDQIAKTSCSINFLNLFKALKEDVKKVLCKQKRQ